MTEIYDLDTNPDNNNAIPPDGAPEGMAFGTVNNVIREFMAKVARYIGLSAPVVLTHSAHGNFVYPHRILSTLAPDTNTLEDRLIGIRFLVVFPSTLSPDLDLPVSLTVPIGSSGIRVYQVHADGRVLNSNSRVVSGELTAGLCYDMVITAAEVIQIIGLDTKRWAERDASNIGINNVSASNADTEDALLWRTALDVAQADTSETIPDEDDRSTGKSANTTMVAALETSLRNAFPYNSITTYAAPGNYTYIVPNDVTKILVQIFGAGGGGGAAASNSGSSGELSSVGGVTANGGLGGLHGETPGTNTYSNVHSSATAAGALTLIGKGSQGGLAGNDGPGIDNRQGISGTNGNFVEFMKAVSPGDTEEIVVGAGGARGVTADYSGATGEDGLVIIREFIV